MVTVSQQLNCFTERLEVVTSRRDKACLGSAQARLQEPFCRGVGAGPSKLKGIIERLGRSRGQMCSKNGSLFRRNPIGEKMVVRVNCVKSGCFGGLEVKRHAVVKPGRDFGLPGQKWGHPGGSQGNWE